MCSSSLSAFHCSGTGTNCAYKCVPLEFIFDLMNVTKIQRGKEVRGIGKSAIRKQTLESKIDQEAIKDAWAMSNEVGELGEIMR